MQVSVTFRHMNPVEELKAYATEKVMRVKKYLYNPLEAHITLSMEKHRNIAEVNIVANRRSYNGKEETDDMHSAIDLVMDKVERQVRRHKEKIKQHKSDANAGNRNNWVEDILPPESEAEGVSEVVHVTHTIVKSMTVEEAVMQLDLSDQDFLVFNNATKGSMNVLYRRTGGYYGLIVPEVQ